MAAQNRRVVLITGCSSGIGRASSIYLAQHGWRVVATARRIESIRDLEGANIDILPLDVSVEQSRVAAMEQAVEREGRLDALVNNAGFSIGGPLELVTLEEARQQFETNVWGALRLIQLAAPVMRAQRGGRVVNVTSVMGRLSVPFSGLYAASKYALEALSDTLRWELNPWNIRVTLVEPGFVQTNFGENSQPFRARFDKNPLYARYLKKDSAARQAVQRPDQPVHVARVIERALTAKHPRARYKSGADAQLALLIRWLVPDWLYDFSMTRVFGLLPRR